MKQLIKICTFISVLALTLSAPDPCAEYTDEYNELEHPDCQQTEYNEYLKCVESKNTSRRKRQTCPFANQDVQTNCRQINFECRLKCAGDLTCESGCPVCPLNVDQLAPPSPISAPQGTVSSSITYNEVSHCEGSYQTCFNGCNQVSTCENDCRQNCPSDDNGYRTVIVKDSDGTATKFDSRIDAAHNITTVIKLTNIVNNTNVVNVPTNVNTTNINTIHVYTNNTNKDDDVDKDKSGKFGLGETDKGSCCFAVRPKTCHASTNGLRCHHRRHKTCGPQCKSRIIHVQQRKNCTRNGGCHKKIAYVPQPQRQRCVYTDQWPHVSCGGGGADGESDINCNGCYDHYGYGYDNYYGKNNEPDCRYCYDDAFDIGPLYRRGPVLRPYYYHEPPCYITGTCIPMVPYDCGYGCFGNDMIDPAWGYGYRGSSPSHHQQYYRGENFDYDDGDYETEDETIIYKDKKGNESEGSGGTDWAVQIHKCKVVSNDGSIEIKNCTSSDIDENPYAAAPSDYPYRPQHEDNFRGRRHSIYRTDRQHYHHRPQQNLRRRIPFEYYDENYVDGNDPRQFNDDDEMRIINDDDDHIDDDAVIMSMGRRRNFDNFDDMPSANRRQERKRKSRIIYDEDLSDELEYVN